MCMTCGRAPCDSRCPNAFEPKAAFTCHRCGCGITSGEEYAKIDGVCYCESCIDDMPYSELIPLLGGEWNRASEFDFDDGSDAAYEESRERRFAYA